MNILYIDDDSEDREIFQEAVHLVDVDSICNVASDGIHGFRMLDELTIIPDLIFVDVNMPGISGREFLIEIKKILRLRTIPVIIYSTTSHPIEMKDYLTLGAFKVLVKPNSFSKVCELISSEIRI